MTAKKIALLSTTRLPKFLGDNHPNEELLFAEDQVLAEAFARRGAVAERIPWRQEKVDWTGYDLVLVRSTWDYIDDLPGFLSRLGDIEDAGCQLVNALETIRWNADKRYLASLAAAGVPVVPTAFLEPGGNPEAVLDKLGPCNDGYVVKPVVGVGAFGTRRFATREATAAALTPGDAADTLIIQPFLPSVAAEGEWSFVFGGGKVLYTALKTPKAGDFRVQVMYGAKTEARSPGAADLGVAQACFGALPVPAHFARMDMARMANGRLALMEAELIEPQLFLFDVPQAADLLADAALALRRPA